MNEVSTSYLLWFLCLFGPAGLHRIYNKKYVSGVVWFCTWGLLGFGQFIDLLLIPGMVEDHNLKVRARLGMSPYGIPLPPRPDVEVVIRDRRPDIAEPEPLVEPKEDLNITLLKAAQARGGKISVTQAVLDTGCGFAEVEQALKGMVKSGYVCVDNDPHTGIVVYHFFEL